LRLLEQRIDFHYPRVQYLYPLTGSDRDNSDSGAIIAAWPIADYEVKFIGMKKIASTAGMIAALAIAVQAFRGDGEGRASGQGLDFIRIYKVFHSGMTGKPVKSVEVYPNGLLILKDGRGEVSERRRLGPKQVTELGDILKGGVMDEEIKDCGRALRTDAEFARIGIESEYKTVTFKMDHNCKLPQGLSRLSAFIDSAMQPHK
jgi:hypothetical protein